MTWAPPSGPPTQIKFKRGWLGCKLVNPLCPDDLCDLPPHHAGVLDNVHRLSTCSEPTQLSSVMFMSPTAESMEDLIREGRQVQSLWEHSRG